MQKRQGALQIWKKVANFTLVKALQLGCTVESVSSEHKDMSGSSSIDYANPISRGRPCTHTELESRVILLDSVGQRIRDDHLKSQFYCS